MLAIISLGLMSFCGKYKEHRLYLLTKYIICISWWGRNSDNGCSGGSRGMVVNPPCILGGFWGYVKNPPFISSWCRMHFSDARKYRIYERNHIIVNFSLCRNENINLPNALRDPLPPLNSKRKIKKERTENVPITLI